MMMLIQIFMNDDLKILIDDLKILIDDSKIMLHNTNYKNYVDHC